MVNKPTGGLWKDLLPWLADHHHLYVNMALSLRTFSLISFPLLIRMPVLLDKAPTFITLFNLNYLLKSSSPNTVH